MPTPLIELQRRITPVGAVRAGGEKKPNRPGEKLQAWRITSPRKDLIEQAAVLYGGIVSPWKSPVGDEWQVYTEAEEIPVLVLPSYSLRQSYELWEGATKRLRVCDGIVEDISGGPCLCNMEGVDRCDIYTRLVVCLIELDSVHGWQVITKGANAAAELPTMMTLVEARAPGQTFVPAKLRIDQRRGVKDGQVVRYVVPTIDLGVGFLALAAQPADGRTLPSGHVPAAPRGVATIEQGLSAVASQPPPPAGGGGPGDAAPLGPIYDPTAGAPAEPLPVEDEPERAVAGRSGGTLDPADPETPRRLRAQAAADEAAREQTRKITRDDPMWRKLNVLVGKLREGGHITNDGLYTAIGKLRKVGGMELALAVGGYDEDHVLHWAPLRDDLLRPEALQLIDWLTIKEKRVAEATRAEAAAAPEHFQPPASVREAQAETVQEPLPEDPFPEGY